MKEKLRSFRFLCMVRTKVFLLFFALIFIMVLAFGFLNQRTERLMYEKINSTNSNLLDFYSGLIEQEFESVELFFVSQRLQQNLYLDVENSSDRLDNYRAAYKIRRIFEDSVYAGAVFDYICLYSPGSGTYVDHNYHVEKGQEESIAGFMRSGMTDMTLGIDQWDAVEIDDAFYIYYLIRVHESYIGGIVNTTFLLNQLQERPQEGFDFLLILDRHGQPLEAWGDLDTADVEALIKTRSGELTWNGEACMATCVPLNDGAFYLAGLMNKAGLAGQLRENKSVVFAVAMIAIIIAAAAIGILWKSLIDPLSKVIYGMKQLRQGRFEYRLEETDTGEFGEITKTFNEMSGEIGALKIQIYEEQLEKQRVELMFLQNQQNPHFLINCLNSLRTLELQHQQERFLDMIVRLGNYMRASLCCKSQVTLETELKNLDDFVQLHKVRYNEQFHVSVDVADMFWQISVPSMILQCFVENAIKHQMHRVSPLKIRIEGDLQDDDEDCFLLRIRDNGSGFDDEVLSLLNNHCQVVRDGRSCVGIYNVICRMRILYGGKGDICFFNGKNGGACIEIKIPMEEE